MQAIISRGEYLHEASQELDLGAVEAESNGAPAQHTFSVQEAIDGKAVLRKVDRHILPFFFSLALLCSIDRGVYLAHDSPSLEPRMSSLHGPFQALVILLSAMFTASMV